MAPMRTSSHEPQLSTTHTQVLGWIASGDVLRDSEFVYRAVGRPVEIDDAVYELDAAGLVDLVVDGRVQLTSAGRRQWARTQSQRHTASAWHQLQFVPASAPPT